MTKRDVLVRYANDWRSLRAWGAVLPMSIEVRPYKGTVRLGLAKSGPCVAWVYDTGDLAGNLKTLLHEMAHLAAPNSEHHGQIWRDMLARGAAEALGVSVDKFDTSVSQHVLNDQVRDAVVAWLDRTGQTVVLKAIGVL